MTGNLVCEFCGLKPWDSDDLQPGDLVCVCDDVDETDPAFILGQYMPVVADGDYGPGSTDGNPLFVAVWLEYARRGGVPVEEVAEYRSWLALAATPAFLEAVMGICAELERLTESGACGDCVGVYLDSLMREVL